MLVLTAVMCELHKSRCLMRSCCWSNFSFWREFLKQWLFWFVLIPTQVRCFHVKLLTNTIITTLTVFHNPKSSNNGPTFIINTQFSPIYVVFFNLVKIIFPYVLEIQIFFLKIFGHTTLKNNNTIIVNDIYATLLFRLSPTCCAVRHNPYFYSYSVLSVFLYS